MHNAARYIRYSVAERYYRGFLQYCRATIGNNISETRRYVKFSVVRVFAAHVSTKCGLHSVSVYRLRFEQHVQRRGADEDTLRITGLRRARADSHQ